MTVTNDSYIYMLYIISTKLCQCSNTAQVLHCFICINCLCVCFSHKLWLCLLLFATTIFSPNFVYIYVSVRWYEWCLPEGERGRPGGHECWWTSRECGKTSPFTSPVSGGTWSLQDFPGTSKAESEGLHVAFRKDMQLWFQTNKNYWYFLSSYMFISLSRILYCVWPSCMGSS